MQISNCPAYQKALKFLTERIDYERTRSMPNAEEAFKLDRMRELLRLLGNPHADLAIVHIAGTKGKGSTAAMTAAVLTAAGLKTGLFTSPHLERVEERIQINLQPCSEQELAELIDLLRPAIEELDNLAASKNPPEHGPTYFEIITAAAFLHFHRQKVDMAIMEVGLGGRLDSTNVCRPLVSVITSISLDHTKQLGSTLSAIAAEKAGIIKPGVPVVSGVTELEARQVIRRAALRHGCRLSELGVHFDFKYYPPRNLEQSDSIGYFDYKIIHSNLQEKSDACNYSMIPLGLLGSHQAANAAIVLTVVEELRKAGFSISDEAIRTGLSRISWPARIEIISRRPVIILDSAHNAASVAALLNTLKECFSSARRILIFATTQEKDLAGMISLFDSFFDRAIFTKYQNNPRGVEPERLLALATNIKNIETAATPAAAWSVVRNFARPDDLICITGSFFIAAEMRQAIASNPIVQ